MAASPTDLFADELATVDRLLQGRYGTAVEHELAEGELGLDPADDTPSVCPTVHLTARGAHCVVFEVAAGRLVSFDTDADGCGTGRDEH